MFELPTSVKVGERTLSIRNNGDYRVIIDCMTALDDYELSDSERVYASLIVFYEDLNSLEDVAGVDIEEAVKQMFWFINCGKPESPTRDAVKLIDWEQDEQLISSAINKVVGKELRLEPYVHWWTFMGYYSSVGESTLSLVVGIRYKKHKGKTLEKYEQTFFLENPEYFTWQKKTRQQAEAEDLLAQIWNTQ